MLLWTSDTHFNFLRPKSYSAVTAFGEYLMEENPDATGIIITGDVSTGKLVTPHLAEFAEGFTKPIYFVLGNHDYYDSSFSKVDADVTSLVKKTPNLHWLNEGWYNVDDIVIVGVNGWYDAYYGNSNSKIELNDFYDIAELAQESRYKELLLATIRKRADREANRLMDMMNDACETSDTIIVCTHVPPYAEAAWHEGRQSDSEWVPWFSSASTGSVIDRFSGKFPNKNFIVLCGHSHSPGIFHRSDNVTVYTAKARYSVPDLTGVVDTKKRKMWAYDSLGKKVEQGF